MDKTYTDGLVAGFWHGLAVGFGFLLLFAGVVMAVGVGS